MVHGKYHPFLLNEESNHHSLTEMCIRYDQGSLGVLKTRNGEDLSVHDEILLEVPIQATDDVALILKETMEKAGRTLLKVVPVETDVAVVGSWAEK